MATAKANGRGVSGQQTTSKVSQLADGQKFINPFPARYIKIRDVAEYLHCSQSQVRLLEQKEELLCKRTLGGHRLFDAQSVVTYAYGGMLPEEFVEQTAEAPTAKLIALARVSSPKQNKKNDDTGKSSLDRQMEQIREYCQKEYGKLPDEEIRSVGSGMNWSRKPFLDLLQRAVTGQLSGSIVVSTYEDRVCRFGFPLVQFLGSLGNVSLDIINENGDDMDSLTQDVMAIMVHMGARTNARKAAKLLKIVLDEEALTRAYRLRKRGFSFQAIADELKRSGHKDSKGRPYSMQVIRRNITEKWQLLETLKIK